MSARIWTCSECSATSPSDPERRGCGLPRGWEHYNAEACNRCVSTTIRPPAEHARPVCGACIAALLTATVAALRAVAR